MTVQKKKFLILAVLFAAIVIAGSFYYWFLRGANQLSQVNHLIPGVPYYGIYNHKFDFRFDNAISLAASVASILGYWGDNRFSLKDLVEQFPPNKFHTSEVYKFFSDNGYEIGRGMEAGEGLTINRIKMFVNERRNIPLIVYQVPLDSQESLPVVGIHRVVIGLFDKDEKVVLHDYYFGNNYEISYTDFEKMFQLHRGAVMAVWPSAELASKLKKESSPPSYSKRTEAMDKLGPLLIKRNSEVLPFSQTRQYDKAAEGQRQIVDDPSFVYLHPAYKVFYISVLGKYLVLADKPDEAIEIITSKALSLNNNLKQPYFDWPELNNLRSEKLLIPYYWLAKAYLKKGDKILARKNFEEALKIDPDHQRVREELDALLKSPK